MDDAGSLEFWRPLLGPVLFVVGAVVLLVVLLFLAALAARLVLALTRVLLRPWWHAAVSLGLTAVLVVTDVVDGVTAAAAWALLLVAAAVSWVFLTVAGRRPTAGRGGPQYRTCGFCAGSGTRDATTCGLCGGTGMEQLRA